jgi:hypothetical protein
MMSKSGISVILKALMRTGLLGILKRFKHDS